jgi:predicted ATPase
MLKNWLVSNFKSIHSMEKPLEFAPLTIFCGANSSGKSSLLQSILLLKQTLQRQQMDKPAIVLNGALVKLGKFSEIISASKQSDKTNDKITVGFTIADIDYYLEDEFRVSIGRSVERSVGSKIEFKLDVNDQPSEHRPIVSYVSITDLNCKETKVTAHFGGDESYIIGNARNPFSTTIDLSLLGITSSDSPSDGVNADPPSDSPSGGVGAGTPSDSPSDGVDVYVASWVSSRVFDHFLPKVEFKKDDLNKSYEKNISMIRDLFSKELYYIGPLRADPKKSSDNAGLLGDAGVGYQGEYTAEYYKIIKSKDKESFDLDNYLEHNNLNVKKLLMENPEDFNFCSFGYAVDQWLRYIDIADGMAVNEEGDLKVKQGEREIGLNNVGVGVSQVLPIIVQCLGAYPGSTIIIEQPELHLHPRMQSRLADFFLVMSLSGKQLIIETHSEYIIDKLRLRVVQAPLDKPINEEIAIYFAEKHKGASEFKRIKINDFSVMSEWPEGFFEESTNLAEEIFREARRKDLLRRENNNDTQDDLDDFDDGDYDD